MKITCDINLEYDSPLKAKKILQSIKVDDYEFVKSSVSKNSIKATMSNTSVSSLLHTLEDYLACVSVAEKIVDKK